MGRGNRVEGESRQVMCSTDRRMWAGRGGSHGLLTLVEPPKSTIRFFCRKNKMYLANFCFNLDLWISSWAPLRTPCTFIEDVNLNLYQIFEKDLLSGLPVRHLCAQWSASSVLQGLARLLLESLHSSLLCLPGLKTRGYVVEVWIFVFFCSLESIFSWILSLMNSNLEFYLKTNMLAFTFIHTFTVQRCNWEPSWKERKRTVGI